MSHWEYMVVELGHGQTREELVANEPVRRIEQVEAVLNEWGASGWEVVGVHGSGRQPIRLVLKRPLVVPGFYALPDRHG